MQAWDYLIEHLPTELPAESMRDMLFSKFENSKVLAQDVSHYRRARAKGPDDPYFTLAFMRKSIDIYVKDERGKANAEDRKKLFALGGGKK